MIPIVFGEGQRSFGVTRGQMVNTLEIACKHYISRSVTSRNLILNMCMAHIGKMIPIVFGGGQRSFGVTRGQKAKIFQGQYLWIWNFILLEFCCVPCFYLLHICPKISLGLKVIFWSKLAFSCKVAPKLTIQINPGDLSCYAARGSTYRTSLLINHRIFRSVLIYVRAITHTDTYVRT